MHPRSCRRRSRSRPPGIALIGLFILAALWLGPFAAVAATAEQASDFIAELTSDTIAAVRSEDPVPVREDRIQQVLRRGLDLDFMSRFVLGHYWREATPEQKEQYREVFGAFIVRTYAHRLANQTITKFAIISVRQTENGDVVVEEKVERPQAPPVYYGFRIRATEETPKVIDVSVEGVSMLLAQRSDFMSVIQKQGFDALIQSIREKMLAP
jgi:phospholipid transport system substrate-binding protein